MAEEKPISKKLKVTQTSRSESTNADPGSNEKAKYQNRNLSANLSTPERTSPNLSPTGTRVGSRRDSGAKDVKDIKPPGGFIPDGSHGRSRALSKEIPIVDETAEKSKPFPPDPKPLDTRGLQAPVESIDQEQLRSQLAQTERMNVSCDEALARNRRPPGTDSRFSNIFYKGPMGDKTKKMSLREKMKAFWLTKQMTDEIDDMELRLRVTMSELLLFLLYIIVLGIVIYGDHTYSSFLLTNSLRRQFVETKFPTSADVPISFIQIKSVADVWNYYEKGFVDSMYWEQYYHRSHTGGSINADDKNVLYENILIGLPRVRMIRVRSDSCNVHPSFRRQFISCFDYYNKRAEEKDPIPNKVEPQKMYTWSDGRSENTQAYSGVFGHYGSGGYSVYLPRSYAAAKSRFQAMKDSNWITRGTRVIFIDFSVFNTQINLFCAIRLTVEFPPSGGAYPAYEFKTTKLFPYITQFDYFVGGAEMTFIFLVIFHLIEEIREMAYFGLRYFYSFSNYVDLIQVLAAFYSIAFLTMRAATYNNAIVKILRNTKDSYANFDDYMYWQWLYTKFTAILFFLAIVKLFKYMQFTASMSQVTYIVRRSAKDVIGFMVMFVVVFAAFTQLGYLLFGTQVSNFRSYTESAFTLLKLILGQFDYLELEQADRILGPIFYLLYVFFLFFILLNMFLAIMNETYSTVRSGKSIGDFPQRVLMEEYFRRGFWNIFTCLEPPSKMSIDKNRCRKIVREIKHALLRNNFTIAEINMFLAKYGIDGKREIDSSDIRKILKDFEKKGYMPTQPPTMEELNLKGRGRDEQSLLRKMDVGWTGLTIKDFDGLLARLEYIEMEVDKMAERLANVIAIIDRAEKTLWTNKKYEFKKPNQNMPC